jgi:hypothetical protein
MCPARAKNIGPWWPLIKEKDHLKNIEFVTGCDPHHAVFQDHQKMVKLLLEASMLFPGSFADTAAILQRPPPPADEPL